MTVAEQYKIYLKKLTTRYRRPIKGSTLAAYQSFWLNWIEPVLGNMEVENVENGALRQLVSRMVEMGMAPASVASVVNCVKGIVASAVDYNGNELYPRKWNGSFIDAPPIGVQNAPIITSEAVSKAILDAPSRYTPLFALLAASGVRISEALALKMRPHPNSSYWDYDKSKIVIRKALFRGKEQSPKTTAGTREVDLAPEINEYLHVKITHLFDYMFVDKYGEPLKLRPIYDVTEKVGIPGLHSFRRFRLTHLENMGVPRGLCLFWAGHAARNVHDGYVRLDKDIKARKEWCVRAGLGFELPKEY